MGNATANANRHPASPAIIAIGGATCSGKTTLARALADRLAHTDVRVLAVDAYYRDLPHLAPGDRAQQNFDHPDAIEWPLLHTHLDDLMRGNGVLVPRYDFSTHTRMPQGEPLAPARVLIVEGLLALYPAFIRKAALLSVFIEVPEEVALARRLARDVRERGRSPESVKQQFHETVRPMAEAYVAPTRAFADIVLRCDAPMTESVLQILARLPAEFSA